jgi:hypothetical protein
MLCKTRHNTILPRCDCISGKRRVQQTHLGRRGWRGRGGDDVWLDGVETNSGKVEWAKAGTGAQTSGTDDLLSSLRGSDGAGWQQQPS